MTSTPPIAAAGDVEEILLSPPSNDVSLIADEAVAAGIYRRPPSNQSPAPFQSVSACSPLSSPEEEKAKPTSVERGGRRQMMRSGTSGSITPISAAQSPQGSTPRKNSSTSSTGGSSSHLSVPSLASGANETTQQALTSTAPSTIVDVSSHESPFSPLLHHSLPPSVSLRRGTDNVSCAARTDGLLSTFATPGPTDSFRSPSQMSVSSEADGYFTARAGSPSEATDPSSLPIHRTRSKLRTALRRQQTSWSNASYATAADYNDAELAAVTSASLSINDEACYVDGEGLASDAEEGVDKSKNRLDFLSQLPPELSLCIVYLLEDHKDLLSASLVSKRWRFLAMEQSIWRHLFFARPGWAIREDAPLVLQHQAELQRIEAQAKRTAARQEAERLRGLQEQRKAASTSSPYSDRLAALKSWRETLHIPSFQHLAGLSIGTHSRGAEVHVDSGRPVHSSAAPMGTLRSPTAAKFGLFLSPARPAPSTPAGARRAQEAAASSSYVGQNDMTQPLSRQPSTSSTTDAFFSPGLTPGSRRLSMDSNYAEVAEAEEYFAASLDWTRLYRDRWVLEQRWMRGHVVKRESAKGEMVRTASATSEGSPLSTPMRPSKSGTGAKPLFEPTKRFLRGHQDSVYCVRQDGGVGTGTAGKLVSGSRDRTIRVWDVETGACKHILKGHTASVLSLQYDDQILVSVSSDGQVFVWDFAAILATSSSSPSPATVDDESGALVHLNSDRLHCILRDHTSAVLDVVFDTNWIVTGSKDATVRVWRRSEIPTLSDSSSASAPVAWRKFSHSGPVNAVDIQDNQVVSASGEGSMCLWDLDSGERVHKFTGHTKGLACIVFKGTTLVSGSNDQTIRVWDTRTGKCTHVLGEHHLLVRTVSYDPVRSLVVSGGYDRLIKMWKVDDATGSTQAEQQKEEDGQGGEEQARPRTSEEEEEGGAAKPIAGRCLRDIKCHRARIFDVDFNTTRIVSASEDHMICITNFGGQGIDTSLFA